MAKFKVIKSYKKTDIIFIDEAPSDYIGFIFDLFGYPTDFYGQDNYKNSLVYRFAEYTAIVFYKPGTKIKITKISIINIPAPKRIRWNI